MPTKVEFVEKESLEARAEEILKEHNLYGVPVDPIALAAKLNITVNNAHFSQSNVSGLTSKRGPVSLILVNASEPPMRKRFTIAHELAHHFLHLSEGGEFVTKTLDLFRMSDDPENAERRAEFQANFLAAALLMPRTLVTEAYRNTPDVGSLARLFNVSDQAMAYRLLELRLG